MNALRKIEGVEEAVKAMSVEMTGAVLHQKNGKMRFLPRRKPLDALDRTNLVIALLNNISVLMLHQWNFERTFCPIDAPTFSQTL